jgi:UDP-N-acetylglucosamine 2-epimerase
MAPLVQALRATGRYKAPVAVTGQHAAGLAAFYQGIPVVHLKAGLRSGNLNSPFPEETGEPANL